MFIWNRNKNDSRIAMNILVTIMCLSIGTPKIINFPFVPNGKLNILGVPNFGHITAEL